MRSAALSLAVLLGWASAAAGDRKPPWQRTLSGADATEARRLDTLRDEALSAERWDDAVRAAEGLRDLRQSKQGADHWQTADAEWAARDARWLKSASAEQRRRRREADDAAPLRELRPAGHPDVARHLSGVGIALSESGRDVEAEPIKREALALARAALPPEHPGVAACLGNLAVTLRNLGRPGEAEPLRREALAVARAIRRPGHSEIAFGLNDLAATLRDLGRSGEAEPLHREALALARDGLPAGHPDAARLRNSLAVTLTELGRDSEAEALHREALAVFRAARPAGHPDIALSLGNLAASLYAQERLGEAEALQREALGLYRAALPAGHADIVRTLDNLAATLRLQARPAEAEPLHRETLAWRRAALPAGHLEIAQSLNNLALALSDQGRGAEAEPLQRESLAIRRAALPPGHPDLALGLRNLAATVLHDRGGLGEAEALYAEAAAASELARLSAGAAGASRADFAAGSASPALGLALARALLGRPRLAWEAAESQFARGLLDDLARGELAPAEREESARLSARLAGVGVSPAESRDLVVRLRAVAARQSARLVAPLERVQAALRPGEAVAFWADDSWSLACVVRRDGGPVWVRLAGRGDDARRSAADIDLAEQVRAALAVPTPEAAPLLAKLRAQRVEPLLPHLKGVSHLFAIPAGDLAGIPLEALDLPFRVSYTPSASVLAFTRERHRDLGRSLLAVGAPQAAALYGARAEIDALCGLVPDARKLVGADASVHAMRQLAEAGDLSKFRLLHFATHGTTDAHRAANGSLILDGRLTAGEIDTWTLDADLAVLSACQTGLGRDANGEGLLGFTQVLMRRGVRSVVVSLWRVDDAATALLMRRFYQNLLERKQGRAAALAEAKAWLRDLTRDQALTAAGELGVVRGTVERLKPAATTPESKAGERVFAHPFYWSAFVLLGDPD